MTPSSMSSPVQTRMGLVGSMRVQDSLEGMALAGMGSRLRITRRSGPLVWVWTFLVSGPVMGFFFNT